MTTIEVTTQAALDDALKSAGKRDIIAIRGSGWFELSDSATVTASDSATVTAYDSATVRAYGSATVTAYGSATVTAGRYVAVRHRAEDTGVTITGGVLIEVPALDTPAAWCDYHDVTVADGIATLYKAVDDDYATDSSRDAGIFYVPGTTAEAPDFRPTPTCGAGLHACPQPFEALAYNSAATRYVAVTAPLAEIVVIDESKVKAPRLTVKGEVTIDGEPIPAPKAKRTRKAVAS